jgi:hypothetical protein
MNRELTASPGGTASGAFPRTRCSVVEATASADPAIQRNAWDALIRAYWSPVYKFIRIRWQAAPEEARDLTQSFFTVAMDSGFFSRFDPARARFRTYQRVCLQGFLANERKAAGRARRGGGYRMIPLDFAVAEDELQLVQAAPAGDPDAWFRHEAIRSLFTLAVASLRDHCERHGRQSQMWLFEQYDLVATERAERPTYQQLAETAGLTVPQVTNQLATVRKQFRRFVLEHLRDISGSEAEFRTEAAELLGIDPADVAV